MEDNIKTYLTEEMLFNYINVISYCSPNEMRDILLHNLNKLNISLHTPESIEKVVEDLTEAERVLEKLLFGGNPEKIAFNNNEDWVDCKSYTDRIGVGGSWFKQERSFVHILKLKNAREWVKYCKEKKL